MPISSSSDNTSPSFALIHGVRVEADNALLILLSNPAKALKWPLKMFTTGQDEKTRSSCLFLQLLTSP